MIRWDEPIEAVHEDGRVVSATLRLPVISTDGRAVQVGKFGEYTFTPDGSHKYHRAWRIRNVAQAPETPHPAPSPSEVGPEVVGKVRDALRSEIERQCGIGAGQFAIDDGYGQSGLWRINADLDPVALIRAAALLPEPVDADTRYARDLICEKGWEGDSQIDAYSVERMIVVAYRAGRAFEKEAGR